MGSPCPPSVRMVRPHPCAGAHPRRRSPSTSAGADQGGGACGCARRPSAALRLRHVEPHPRPGQRPHPNPHPHPHPHPHGSFNAYKSDCTIFLFPEWNLNSAGAFAGVRQLTRVTCATHANRATTRHSVPRVVRVTCVTCVTCVPFVTSSTQCSPRATQIWQAVIGTFPLGISTELLTFLRRSLSESTDDRVKSLRQSSAMWRLVMGAFFTAQARVMFVTHVTCGRSLFVVLPTPEPAAELISPAHALHMSHTLHTLRILQVVAGYFLMLIAMTYQVELFLAVVFGLGVGHTAFNTKAPVGESVDACCVQEVQVQVTATRTASSK